MEIGLLQLFWLVLIMAIFIVSAIKRYLRNKKSQSKLSNINIREREELKRRKLQDKKVKTGWEEFMSDMLGVEPIEIRPKRPEKEDRPELKHKEKKKKEEVAKTESIETVESGIREFHTSIEDRHIKSQLEEKVLQPTIAESHIVPVTTKQKKEKVYTPLSNRIFRKNGFKEAIIFSEIISTPVVLRKRSRFRSIR